MGFIDTHKMYQKYKEDPLVLLLLKYFRTSKSIIQIPPVWKSFIEKSTEKTDINLLLSQLNNWGINDEIDFTLRGTALLDNIHDSRLRTLFIEADATATAKKIAWNAALELVFIHRGFVPSAEARQILSKGFARVGSDITYTETGTIRYKIHRRIPAVVNLIPPEWFLANCGPGVSDSTLLERFRQDYAQGFPPNETKAGGKFALKAWFKKILCYTDRARFDPNSLTSRMNSYFPKQVNGALFEDEQTFYLELLGNEPDELSSEEAITRRNVQFSFKQDRRGHPRQMSLDFPCFTAEDRDFASSRGLHLPSATHKFVGSPKFYFDGNQGDMGQEQGENLVKGLRRVYTELHQATEYEELRKNALKT